MPRRATLGFVRRFAILAIVGAGIALLWRISPFGQIAAAESKVTSAAAYEPAAKTLALLCQSDPFFFRDEPPLAPAWTPPEVLKLQPSWVEVTPDGARVEFGGGFHHFGYNLERDKAVDTDTLNGWTLLFYSEDSRPRTLKKFTLKKTDQIDQEQFITGALTEFERRAASGNSDRSVNERLAFLLKFNDIERARKSIRDCTAASPNDWADHLLAYIIDARNDPAARGRLDSWAQKQGDCSAWLLAVYAYALAGNYDDAERATKLALTKPVDDPDWLSYNARYRGATVALQLFKARRYATCAALCDTLLAYNGGPYLAPQITAMRDLSRHAGTSTPQSAPPAFDEGTVFEPFKGIDLSRLVVAAATTLPAFTRPANPTDDPRQARLLEYLDHRIAADPTSKRNYTEKIGYLLSLKRTADALVACQAAARAFPNWWRPQVTLVMLADPGSRPGAEASFHKWVQDNPAFIHWWYLCRYYRDRGRHDDAVAALKQAVKYSLEGVDEDATWVPAAFAFDATDFAYRQKQYGLVLEIARVWGHPRGVYNYFDDDIYAFRAAAELKLGQVAAARADADRVVKAASEHAIWAGHLAELQQAVMAGDQNFEYEPGNLPSEWSLSP
jgi:hypothetical protein